MSQTVKGRILKGIGASSFAQVINVLIQVVSLPLFLAVWKTERYGEWLVLSSWSAFLALSDVGFASVASNEMTMRVGRGDRAGALVTFQSVGVLLCVGSMLMLAIVVALLWGTTIASYLPLKVTTPHEAAAVLTVLAGVVCVSQQLGLLDAGFKCDGNYAFGVWLTTWLRLAEFCAQAATVLLGGSLFGVAVVSLIVRVVSWFVFRGFLHWRSPWLAWGWKQAELSAIRRLAWPAVGFLGMPLGHVLTIQGMINTVGAALTPAVVPLYSAHRTLTNVATQLMGMINHSVWPELSRAQGGGDIPLTRRLHRAACSVVFWIAIGCAVGILTLGWWFIPFWTGGKFQQNFSLMAWLLVAMALRALWYTSSVVLLSSNRHQQLSGLFLVSGVASLGLAWWLLKEWGLPGAAFGASLGELAMTTYVLRTVLIATEDTGPDFIWTVLRAPLMVRFHRPSTT